MWKSEVESRRVSSGHRCLVTLSQLVIVVFLSLAPSVAQVQEQSSKERKLITRVDPEYPETMKRLYIGRVVRVEVDIEPSVLLWCTKLRDLRSFPTQPITT